MTAMKKNTPDTSPEAVGEQDPQALRRAEHRYQELFENLVAGLFQSTPEGRFIRVNPALAQILGYENPAEVLKTVKDLRTQLYADPADRNRLLAILAEKGAVSGLETRFLRKDGSTVWISQAARMVRDEGGRLLYIEGLNVDISKRKAVEAAQRESEELFRLTFDQAPSGAFFLSRDYRFLKVNEALCRLVGYEPGEFLALTLTEVEHPDDLARDQPEFEALWTGTTADYATDCRFLHKDGQVVWLRLSASIIHDAAGAPKYLLPMVRDITERKRMLAALSSAESRLKELLTANPAVIYSCRPTPPHAPTFVSSNARGLLGFLPEEFLSRPEFWDSRLHPEDVPLRRERMADLAQAGSMVFEYRFLAGNGAYIWLRDQVRLVRDEAGRGKEAVGFLTDVTTRRFAAERLRESEARYRAVVEDQTELVARFLPDGSLTFVNEAFARYFRHKKEDLIGAKHFPAVPSEDQQLLRRHLAALNRANPTAQLEHRVLLPDGAERWVQRVDHALFDDTGTFTEFQSVARDVTDRVQSARHLARIQEENERYRLNLEAMFRSIPDAIVTVDKDMRVIQTNRALTEICCVGRKLTQGTTVKGVSGRCERACFQILQKTLSTGEPVVEYRVECATEHPGKVLIINTSPLLDKDNQFMGAVLIIRDITRLAALEMEVEGRHGYRNIIGKSKIMQDLYRVLEQLSEVDSTVLITGESGTGKELIAEALHYGGPRSSGPLIKVNCSALSENLLESELFGHVRGAFTGAVMDKVGRFQAAEGGTIFLDEIGDISPRIQLNLLRVLERKEYERVGDSRTLKANVRVIAATNVDLPVKIRQGLFREDLYYRLRVMVIHLPPLRERADDIPLLCDHFLQHFRMSFGKNFTRVSEQVMDVFMNAPWPGNIRELKYTLEHACILCPAGEIELRHLPRELLQHPSETAAPLPPAPGRFSLEDLNTTIERCGGNKSRAARMLGIDRKTLYRNLERLGG
jgi:PAS domain S-box-containing protein